MAETQARSEVELVDVALVKDKRLAQQDAAALDLKLAQRTGFDALVAGLEVAFGQRTSSIHGELAFRSSDPSCHGGFIHYDNVLKSGWDSCCIVNRSPIVTRATGHGHAKSAAACRV